MNKLTLSFKDSLLDPNLLDVGIELAELGIDSVLDDGIFTDIPIANTLIGLGKTALNLHDRNLLKQTINFINTFNANTIPHDKLVKYCQRLDENPKYAEAELGRVLILLDSTIDHEKSKILAKFYRAYVNEEINWERFCELSDITSRLFVVDLSLLNQVYREDIFSTSQCPVYQAERLNSLGLLNLTVKSMQVGPLGTSKTEKYISLSDLGELFCSLLEK